MSLAKLSRLPMAIPSSEPDVRGWPVLGVDERLVGTVIDLILEAETRTVLYLVVQLTDGLHVPLPLGKVSLIEGDGQILARELDSQAIRCLPAMPPDPLDEGREFQLYATFLPHHSVDYQCPEFRWGGERSFTVTPLPPKPYENKFVPTPDGRQTNRGRFD
ncbi:hypothetical protein D3C87_927250 [compost metagenome]